MEAPAPGWSYANNWRIAASFLASAMFLLGIGVLLVASFGDAAAFAGVIALVLATFLLVFSVLVFLPRLAHRGSVSFSLLARRSMEEAERAVRDAIEEVGRAARVRVAKSRSRHPPRIVVAEGVSVRFRIEAAHYGPIEGDDRAWTEIVQSVSPAANEEAHAFRERIATRLNPEPSRME